MSCQTNGQTNGPCPNWTYDPNLTNRISTAGFTYDAAGNLTADGTHSYQWDGEGRLVTVDNGATIVLVHNALGQQVGVTGGGGTDINWQLRSQAGKPQGNYSIAYVGWNLGFFFLGDKLVGADTGNWEGMVFLHQNHLNSVTVPTTFDGSRFDDILYYPWGQYWEGEGFVFAGMDHYWQDVLHNTPNRQYAFYEGRWLSPDPLAGDVTNPQSLNRYAYVLNNPTSFTDPLGLGRDRPLPPKTGGDPGCDPFTGVGCPPDGGGGGIDPCSDPWYADSHAECGTPPLPPPPGGGGGGGGGGGQAGGGGCGGGPAQGFQSPYGRYPTPFSVLSRYLCWACQTNCEAQLAKDSLECGVGAGVAGALISVIPGRWTTKTILQGIAHAASNAGKQECKQGAIDDFNACMGRCTDNACRGSVVTIMP